MKRLDGLPPDQRAALALIVGQHKSYAQLAGALGIDDQAVHDRAHAALAMLAPALARRLTPEQRELVGEHVLGQAADPEQSERTEELLDSSPAAREWAAALEAELAPLAGTGDTGAPDPPPAEQANANGRHVAAQAPRRAVPSSRLGGAILLALLVAGIVVAVVLTTGGGGSSSHHNAAKNAANTSTTPRVTSQIALQAVEQGSHAAGAVEVLQSGSKRAFYMIASHLAPTQGFYYAIWLWNSATSHEPVSRAPAVGASHRFEGGSFLPEDAANYKYILLTRETSTKPAAPSSHVVLAAQFSVGH
jgi:hypothetical protein